MGLVSLIAHVYYQEIDDIAHDSGRDTKGVPKVGAFIPCCDGQIGITKRTVPMHLSIVLDALIVCTRTMWIDSQEIKRSGGSSFGLQRNNISIAWHCHSKGLQVINVKIACVIAFLDFISID